MSMLLMVKAMKIKVGNPTKKLVLIKLADNANDSGECWPSYQHIADHCEIDRRTAMRHINQLEIDGFLRKEYRKGEKGNSSNVYYLSLGGGDHLSPCGVNVSLGGGDHLSPRTSHSFESVKEPLSSASQKDESLDDNKVINTWNDIAKQRNFKGCRIITDTVRKNITKIYAFHCKEKKSKKQDPLSITEFTCAYLTHGFERWAGEFYSGKSGYRADLEYATRKAIFEKVYSEL